ncbi:MAG TPA: 2OG-Fe(II) oxygenase [Burkholderiales bacterium]|nr:2OG-Fe(II) oxygenase [Burkholderiales bacterium]
MPRAGFLALLGWFVRQEFFDTASCASMRREMQCSPTDPARILDGENQLVIESGLRRTEVALMSAATQQMVTYRLIAIKPMLEKQFGFELSGCEPPSFLIYKEGFYYGRHADANLDPAAPARFQQRRVSISIFLNGEGGVEEPDTYSGGSLTFHGSPREAPNAKNLGLAVEGEEGLLIGFRSDWPHEVQPVLRGTRYSIVTWFS